MLVLGTTILIMQAVLMPVGMVYTEATMDTDEQELVELPAMKNYLEEVHASNPHFFFTRSRLQGMTEEPVQVTFFSDQKVSEARVFLPEEATLLKDQLATGISIEEGEQSLEWIVHSKRAQNTFVLPLVFEKSGNYELSVGDTTAHLEISEEVPGEETESSNEDLLAKKDVKEEIAGYGILKNQLSDIPFPPPLEIGHADKPMDQFDRWVSLDSSGDIESGWENIPATTIYSATSGSSRTLINGNPVSHASAVDSMGPIITPGDIIIFENVGTGVDDKPFHARFEVIRTRNSTGINNVMRLNSIGFNNRTGEGTADFSAVTSFVYNDGTNVDGDVLLSLDGSATTNHGSFYITLLNENIKAVLGQPNSQNGWGETDGITTTIKPGASLNIIVPGAPHVQVFSRAVRNSVVLFEQQGPSLDISYDELSVKGAINDERFISEFNIIQRIPKNRREELEIYLNAPDILNKDGLNIRSIINTDGDNLIEDVDVYFNDESNEWIIYFSQEIIDKQAGKNINLALNFTIDKDNNPENYLEEDYLEIGIEVMNSLSSTIAADTAFTWARPWGDPVPQEVGAGISTTDLDSKKFVDNLSNKLEGDAPFVVGFSEEQSFYILGNTFADVIIESEISGIQNIIEVPVTVVEKNGSVFVHYLDRDGNLLADPDELVGKIGEVYETHAKEIQNYHVVMEPDNATGIYEENQIKVTYIYDITPISPLDPLDPEVEVDPENQPGLPEDQGLLSIDFISSFNFGSQGISVQDQWYYAQPQRLLNPDGTINEGEERPNYIQISDRRSENDRHSWQLAVTQNSQFTNLDEHELAGARLHLTNQQFATAQDGVEPVIRHQEGVVLIPEHRTELITAKNEQGTGTWIYRFGDGTSAGESVALEVPQTALPRATTYQTTLTWELSAVPENE